MNNFTSFEQKQIFHALYNFSRTLELSILTAIDELSLEGIEVKQFNVIIICNQW